MKWEPLAAMVALLALGVWVVWSPAVMHDTRPGAQLSRFQLGGVKGELEAVKEPDGECSFRLLYRGGGASPVISASRFREDFGPEAYQRAIAISGNSLFRTLNVTSWIGVAWVMLGFAGQGAFFGRMWIQWVVSERSRQSIVPEAFWWLSLAGGVLLFAYFAWRQDIVGVLGQTSGVVIYARNIRLIHKQQRRAARAAARAQADAAPEPMLAEESPSPEVSLRPRGAAGTRATSR